MKPTKTTVLVMSLFAASGLDALAYDGQLGEKDRLVVTAHKPDTLLMMDREGAIRWRSDESLKHPQQVSALPDGRVFCATIDGATMFQPDASVQWRYQVPAGAENAVALYLNKGRLLVAHEGMGELVELDEQGAVRGKTQVEALTDQTHGQFRYVGYARGHYLVPMLNAKTFREIRPGNGKVVWEVSDLPVATFALGRPDKGTYIGYQNTISSYDARQKLEWKIHLTDDLGLPHSVPPTGSVLLPKGNLIMCLWHRHADMPDLIEFDPVKKQIVHQWDLDGISEMGSAALLPAGHAFLEKE